MRFVALSDGVSVVSVARGDEAFAGESVESVLVGRPDELETKYFLAQILFGAPKGNEMTIRRGGCPAFA